MSWIKSIAKRRALRSRRWRDLVSYSYEDLVYHFQYRRVTPYVECVAFVSFPWRMLWHKAVWETDYDRVSMEDRDRMAKNILKRLAERKAKAKSGSAVADPAAAKSLPNLYTLMTALIDEDAKERRVATLTVFADDGCYKVCLNERNVNLSLWASSETLQGLWEALEARLSVDDVDWKEGKPQAPTGPKKK